MQRRHEKRRKSLIDSLLSRRGQILVMVAAGMVMLMSVAGLAIDVGIWYKDQRTLEHAAELAAMSGYRALVEEQGALVVNSDGTIGDCPVKTAIENSLNVNGIINSEITSATIRVSKSGLVQIDLVRESAVRFSSFALKKNFQAVAGAGEFLTNRMAPFAIPEQYNDEDRDQRPNYTPADTNNLVDPPYSDFDSCAYAPGAPYILLYSVDTNPTTNDWIIIPMDDDVARIPIGDGSSTGSMGLFEVKYDTSAQGGTLTGQGHLPHALDESTIYTSANLDGGSTDYVLWQDTALTINADNQVDKLYQYSLFRAYGIMWDILGAAAINGQYPYVRWIKGLHGGAFAVEKRFLEEAGYTLYNITGPSGYNRSDYRRIVRTSNPQGLTKGKSRKTGGGVGGDGDTGVVCIHLRFGDWDSSIDSSEEEYVRHRIRSSAFWRFVGTLNQNNQVKSLEFGKTTTSEATRIQPVIGTYTGTTDPVTRVLGWAGIPFDAFFGDYNPRVTLDPNSTCLESYKLFDNVSLTGAYLSDSQTIVNYLSGTQGYHWLHVHHENFADDVENSSHVQAMAWAIRTFCQNGGFLFDACLGAETIETALAYLEQGGGAADCSGSYSGLTKTLAHGHFLCTKYPPFFTPRISLPSGSIGDISGYTDPPTYPSTIFGDFKLTDPLNSRSQNHKGWAENTTVIDYEAAEGNAPPKTISLGEVEPINVYTGSFMSFREQLLRNPETPVDGAGLETVSKAENRDVLYVLGRFRQSHDGAVTGDMVDAAIYLSGTVRKNDGSQGGQFAMIGGHLPHHGSPNEETDYDVSVREYFIEGAWYHPTATHIPWKLKKVFKGDPDDRGDGKVYHTPTDNVSDPTPCEQEMIIAWRGLLSGRNWDAREERYGAYIRGGGYWWWGVWAHWDDEPEWRDTSHWINGAWDGGTPPGWNGDPPHWDTLPTWGAGGPPQWWNGDVPNWVGDPPHWLGSGPTWTISPGWTTPPGWTSNPGWTIAPGWTSSPGWDSNPGWTVEPVWEEYWWSNPKGQWVIAPELGYGIWYPVGSWLGAWVNGTWDGGSWNGGVWESQWYGGVWQGGVWESAWQADNWIGGTWDGGTWYGGDWAGGDWEGGDWQGADWEADWFEEEQWWGGDWVAEVPNVWKQKTGWNNDVNNLRHQTYIYQNSGSPIISKADAEGYIEVLANLNYSQSGWWDAPASLDDGESNDSDEPGDLAVTMWYNDVAGSIVGNNVMDTQGDISNGDTGWWADRFGTSNFPSLENRDEWGTGWPTLWKSPRDIDLDNCTIEDCMDSDDPVRTWDSDDGANWPNNTHDDTKWPSGHGPEDHYEANEPEPDYVTRVMSYYRRPCEVGHIMDMHGGEGAIGEDTHGRATPWRGTSYDIGDSDYRVWIECQLDNTIYSGSDYHKPISTDDAWETYRKRFPKYYLYRFYKGGSRLKEMYGSYFRNYHLSRQWSNGVRLLRYPTEFWGYTMGMPRWLIYQMWLMEKGHIDGYESTDTPILAAMENHGYDMCVRDLDNDGITGDIYEKGAIYRGVPDRAFHRLYLNNILLGALAAEMGNDQTGGVNCGAVNWDLMDANEFANSGASFGTNSFVDIMRLGVKGGGLRVGDTFQTAPARLVEAVDEATEYMFTDENDTRQDGVTSVKWYEHYVAGSAPANYYLYNASGSAGVHKFYDDSDIFNDTTFEIKPNAGDFLARPMQIMSIAVVERTDGTHTPGAEPCNKSIYYTPPNGLGAEITVKVIGFARFFVIDPVNDTMTYSGLLSNPGQPSSLSTFKVHPNAKGTSGSREVFYLGPDGKLPGEVRGHFLGWEVRPPCPGSLL